jgi:Rrf2 family transcriptional regulator, iron-sulfur cluster assembly transcription factor
MKIAAQEEFGLRCLLRFARAGSGQSLTIPEIAALEGISVPYAGKLLALLRQGGLIESSRGRHGGYAFGKAPAEVSLGSVLHVLGEPLFDAPEFCERHAGAEAERGCVHQGGCSLRALWQALDHWMRSALDRLSLADLLRDEGSIAALLRSRLAAALDEAPPLIPLTKRRLDRPPPGEES